MKVPFSWLKELVDIDVTAQELEEKLFSCGFEVEELIPLDAGISKVVVGRIVEMEPQEGTHLTKCVVDCGEYSYGDDLINGLEDYTYLGVCFFHDDIVQERKDHMWNDPDNDEYESMPLYQCYVYVMK